MTRDQALDVLSRLLGQIAPEVDVSEVDEHAPIQEVLDLDSMDFLNLMVALHESTGLDVPERDYPQLSTVAGFASYVADRAPA